MHMICGSGRVGTMDDASDLPVVRGGGHVLLQQHMRNHKVQTLQLLQSFVDRAVSSHCPKVMQLIPCAKGADMDVLALLRMAKEPLNQEYLAAMRACARSSVESIYNSSIDGERIGIRLILQSMPPVGMSYKDVQKRITEDVVMQRFGRESASENGSVLLLNLIQDVQLKEDVKRIWCWLFGIQGPRQDRIGLSIAKCIAAEKEGIPVNWHTVCLKSAGPNRKNLFAFQQMKITVEDSPGAELNACLHVWNETLFAALGLHHESSESSVIKPLILPVFDQSKMAGVVLEKNEHVCAVCLGPGVVGMVDMRCHHYHLQCLVSTMCKGRTCAAAGCNTVWGYGVYYHLGLAMEYEKLENVGSKFLKDVECEDFSEVLEELYSLRTNKGEMENVARGQKRCLPLVSCVTLPMKKAAVIDGDFENLM